ncbi:hypothetical protein Tco_0371348 [Tanacetum coccineum]
MLLDTNENLTASTTLHHSIRLTLTEPPKPDTNHSIIAELNSFDCASNTHNIISDEGFRDFSMKYLGGLHILIQLPDSVSVQNALTNTTFKTYFKSLIAWNDGPLLNISNRITWLSISGLPPGMWLQEPFTTIAELWGQVLMPEECNDRRFNRSFGKVCILTNHHHLIHETIHAAIGKDIYPIRVSETEGEIDMFFNGYSLASSSDEDYDPPCEANVDEDTWWHDKVNSSKDGEADDDSRDKIDESVGCSNPTREGHNFSNGIPFMECFGEQKNSENVTGDLSKEGSTYNPVEPGSNDKCASHLYAKAPALDHRAPAFDHSCTIDLSCEKSTDKAKKAQQNQNPEAGQTSMARDGSVFRYDPDYLREQFAGLVIQRALPFNRFDHEQTTRVFQNTMQPRYTHVSHSTLKRDAMKLWLAAKQEIIDSFGNINACVNLTTNVWSAPHGVPGSYMCVTAH